MEGDFDVQPLGTVANVRSGYAFKSDDMGAVGLPVIKIKNVVPPTVDITDCERVPEEVISSIPRVERFELKEGDTLIAMTGATVGKVGKFPRTHERYFLNQRVGKVYLTEPDAADYRYIYYILSQDTYVRQMFGIADGRAQANISGSQIESLEVPLPPLSEQRAIASVLGALDDKIEVNRRMNATLEAMARALFQSWFVDFDPVRAKSEGRQPEGMDADTAALFPAEFEDSELGMIPKGWRVGRIADVSDFSRSSINPGQFPDEIFDHYSLPAFDEGRTPKVEIGSAIKSNKLIVTHHSVLISKLNPHIPRIWLPDLHATFRSVCSTEFIVASTRPGYSREFLFSLFTSSDFATTYGTLVTGTTGSHQRIRPESVLDMKTLISTPKLVESFSANCKPMFDQINRNIDQSRTLAALRDTLLPKLLSGDLRVAKSLNDDSL